MILEIEKIYIYCTSHLVKENKKALGQLTSRFPNRQKPRAVPKSYLHSGIKLQVLVSERFLQLNTYKSKKCNLKLDLKVQSFWEFESIIQNLSQ